jgi:hypothetical protein
MILFKLIFTYNDSAEYIKAVQMASAEPSYELLSMCGKPIHSIEVGSDNWELAHDIMDIVSGWQDTRLIPAGALKQRIRDGKKTMEIVRNAETPSDLFK